jgi:ankyrin repeat protein
LELVRWLVQHGANPNARCKFDITPLSLAATHASYEVIELLFELGASVKYGQPLTYAARHNRPDDIIELLLRKGALVNSLMFQNHDLSFHHFKSLGLGTALDSQARAAQTDRPQNAVFFSLGQPLVTESSGWRPS